MSSALVGTIVVANMGLALLVAGRVLQRSERSRFRYTMWQIRDGLVDDLDAGRLAHDRRLVEYLNRLELTIDVTELFTPYHLISAARIMRHADCKIPQEALYLGADPASQAIIAAARSRASLARMRLFFAGSPSGWFLLVSSPLAALWWLAKDRATDRRSLLEAATLWFHNRYGSPIEVLRCWLRATGGPKTVQHRAYV